jgi:hypothetical protein
MDRTESLEQWLARIGARHIATVEGPNGTYLDFYMILGATFIVLRFADEGWDLFVPASLENSIPATLQAAEVSLALIAP